MHIPRVIVAGTHRGAGKTSVTLGVLRALRRRGLTVQPFKVGPDFLDPGLHTLAADGGARSRISRNLDTWLLPHATVVELFARAADGADIAVTEGMMGLYDGVDGRTDAGSTAEVSKLLQVPVILVVDAAGARRRPAAAPLGVSGFGPGGDIPGVIGHR